MKFQADNKNNFNTKIQEDSQRRLEVKGQLSKLSILAKKGQILVLNGQNFAISEFSRHIKYNFLKEDHKNNFHAKNQEDSQRRLEVIGQKLSKLSILAKKWPNFGLKWPKFCHIRILHIEYDFFREDHRNNFHTKHQEDSQRRLEVIGKKLSKLSILAKKWP